MTYKLLDSGRKMLYSVIINLGAHMLLLLSVVRSRASLQRIGIYSQMLFS